MKLSIALYSAAFSGLAAAVPCADYSNLVFDLEQDCSGGRIIEDVLLPRFEAASGCTNFNRDIRQLLGTSDTRAAREYLNSLCQAALDAAANAGLPPAGWNAISEDAGVNLQEYFEGGGFLNTETGNFQQDADDLDPASYYYTGTDPRENDHYPTTEESYQAGVIIDGFLETAETYYLTDPTTFGSTCQYQAAMCCWHRDRQYADNNGNCRSNDCFERDPGDNTDLCWTEDNAGTPTPYPGEDVEGPLHCHGFAWSDTGDVNTDARWNNLFYVSMHDHMYTRGYVQSVTDDPDIDNVQAMCGCIEDMNPVSRADCTEAIPIANYTLTTDANSVISINVVADTLRIEFEACEGYKYNSNILPEGYDDALDLELLAGKDNDLSAFAYRLYLEQKMSLSTMEYIFHNTLVGYEDPDTNNNVQACKDAYETKFPGEVYA